MEETLIEQGRHISRKTTNTKEPLYVSLCGLRVPREEIASWDVACAGESADHCPRCWAKLKPGRVFERS